MDDDGVARWAAFNLENSSDGVRVEGIGGQAVDRLGRQGDQFTGTQQGDAPLQCFSNNAGVSICRTSVMAADCISP